MEIYISLEESEAAKEDLLKNSLTLHLILIRDSTKTNDPRFAGGWIREFDRRRKWGYDGRVNVLITRSVGGEQLLKKRLTNHDAGTNECTKSKLCVN